MKLFVKVLGGLIYGFLIVFLIAMYLGCLVGSIYGVVWAWTSLETDTETKAFVSALSVIGFFVTLTMIYFNLDDVVNPTRRRRSFAPPPCKPITPTPSQQPKKSKPILP